MTSENLVYYDTNIWVAWMRGRSDKFFPQSQALVDRIISGKNVAIVSNLILLETIDVLRKRIVKNSQMGDAPEDHAAIRRKIDAVTEKFLNLICKMSENKQVLMVRPSLHVEEHHARVLTKFRRYFGSVHTVRGQNRHRYKGLGHADFEHALLALSYMVPEFYTADNSFEDLKGDSDFSSIHFNTIKPL